MPEISAILCIDLIIKLWLSYWFSGALSVSARADFGSVISNRDKWIEISQAWPECGSPLTMPQGSDFDYTMHLYINYIQNEVSQAKVL